VTFEDRARDAVRKKLGKEQEKYLRVAETRQEANMKRCPPRGKRGGERLTLPEGAAKEGTHIGYIEKNKGEVNRKKPTGRWLPCAIVESRKDLREKQSNLGVRGI